ncbi:rRNA biogenesis protein rrp36 [Amphichorda felina]
MPAKRKLPSLGLERRVRPRREDEWELETGGGNDSSADDAVSEEGVGDDDDQDDGSSHELESDEDESEDKLDASKLDIASISFGALAKAQASLPPSKKHKQASGKQDGQDDDKPPRPDKRSATSSARSAPATKRTSKHAPQEQSSKRPVSRLREVISTETKRAPARDPRFDPVSGTAARLSEAHASRAYSFLDEYRDKEVADLRAQVKKTKDPAQKEELKRQIMSIESRRKARKQKEEAERVLAEHRRKEKELVAQGKQPFYLKRSEQKKQLLVNRYAGMSKGQADKAMQRKRKKVAGKEKKELDWLQRVPDRHGRGRGE